MAAQTSGSPGAAFLGSWVLFWMGREAAAVKLLRLQSFWTPHCDRQLQGVCWIDPLGGFILPSSYLDVGSSPTQP